MKTKLLVAMIACLAIGACSKAENKEEPKSDATQKTEPASGTGTDTTTPSAPAGGGHSLNETTTNLAIDETASQHNAVQQASDADKKLQDMKQDMNNSANQLQQGTSTQTDAAKTDANTPAED